jgi:tetratricopeptide (TPR) repeat protein
MRLSFSLLLLSVLIAAQPQGRITVEYPLEGSLFPPDFAPPTFLFKDSVSSNTAWRAEVRFAQGAPMRLDVHARSAYGGMLAETGDTEKALVHLRIALELTPDSPDALNNWAGALARAGRFQKSLPCFRKALELEPGSAILHFNFGRALAASGDSAAGLAHVEKAAQLSGGDEPLILERLADLYYSAGRAADALAAARRAAGAALRKGDQALAARLEEKAKQFER